VALNGQNQGIFIDEIRLSLSRRIRYFSQAKNYLVERALGGIQNHVRSSLA